MIFVTLTMLVFAVSTQTYLSGAAAIAAGSTLSVLSVPFLLAIVSVLFFVRQPAEPSDRKVIGIFFLAGLFWLGAIAVRPDPSPANWLFVLLTVVSASVVFGAGIELESRQDTQGNYFFFYSGVAGLCAVIAADTASVSYGMAYGTLVVVGLYGCLFNRHSAPDCAGLRILVKIIFIFVTTAAVIFGALPLGIGGIFFMLFLATGVLKSIRSLGVAVMLGLPLLILSCSPLKPSGGRYQSLQQEGTIMFQLSKEGMNLLLTEQWKVRVRVHKVENASRGEQEGNDSMFAAADSTPTFRVEGVKLGLKDFVIDIINGSNESVGHGESRHLVRPGEQALQEIHIEIVPPEQRRRELTINWVVRVKIEGEQPPVTYQHVKQTFENYCVSCHAADSRPQPAGKLVLSDYPFYYTNGASDPAGIVNDSLFWMKAADYPMPPAPAELVPRDQIAAIQTWLADGLMKFPMSDNMADLAHKIIVHWELSGTSESGSWEVARPDLPDQPFRSSLENAVVGGKYKFRTEVMGIDGTKVHEMAMEYRVGPSGDTMIEVEIEGGNPAVIIPIVIEP